VTTHRNGRSHFGVIVVEIYGKGANRSSVEVTAGIDVGRDRYVTGAVVRNLYASRVQADVRRTLVTSVGRVN